MWLDGSKKFDGRNSLIEPLKHFQVLGAFDDLNNIADVCGKYKLWLHADACLGGSAIFSRKHRNLMTGNQSHFQSESTN